MKTNKELKNEYKQLKPEAGILQISNLVNGKYLIEESENISAKINRHRTELRFGSHRNKALQADWNEQGEDQFTFSTLELLEIKDDELLDIKQELKTLKAMVLADRPLDADLRY